MCFCLGSLRAFRRRRSAKTATPPAPNPDSVPATKKTNFIDLPGEVRTEIYKLCIDDHLKRPFTPSRIYDVTSIMPKINTPAICRINRSTRPEALAVLLSRARWVVNGGIPTPIGEESTLNGLNVHGMGFGLGYGRLKYIGIPDFMLLAPPGRRDPYDWVCNQRFFPDDIALGTWGMWCEAVESLGLEAENGISKLRVRTYVHKICRPEFYGFGGLWNEYGLMGWDIDLIENKKKEKKRAFLRGGLTKKMAPLVAEAEELLEEMVVPLREKRVDGLLRVRDIKVLVETFTAHVAEMGLDEETKFLKQIAF